VQVLFALGLASKQEADDHVLAGVFLKEPIADENTGDILLDGRRNQTGKMVVPGMMKRAGKKGIEAMRSGGALGRCSRDDPAFKEFIKQPGMCPRLRHGCHFVIINSTGGRCGFYIMYITPYEVDRRCVPFFYNSPRRGGHQMLLDEQIATQKVLHKFPECRRDAALLLLDYNENHRLADEHPASSLAAKIMKTQWLTAELAAKKWAEHGMMTTGEARQKAKHKHFEMKCDPFYWLGKYAKHTIVTHAVGWHRDVFASNGTDNIENKVLLLSKCRSDWMKTASLGRGGAGRGAFVFGLLDWEAPIRARRALYLQLGGDEGVVLTQQLMDEFLEGQGIA
jgi:hypothetical protein